MKLSSIIKKLEEAYPLYLEEKWDNSGLVIGDKNSEITAIQISLDITESVIDKAIESGCKLIITHHPPIFDSLKKINDSTVLGKKILKLIKNDINVYSLHTNLDSAKEGLNFYIAKKLFGKDIKVMAENYELFYKLNIKIPEILLKKTIDIVNNEKTLIFSINEINDYFSEEKEYEIKITGMKEKIYSVSNKINGISSENLEYEIFALENKNKTACGLGRIYSLETPIKLEDYAKIVKEQLGIESVKIVKSNDKLIKKVAIVNGSGADFWKKAYDLRADLFITGDIKYHTALDAYEKSLNLMDIGHYESEQFFNEIIIKKLDDNLQVEVYNEKGILEIV